MLDQPQTQKAIKALLKYQSERPQPKSAPQSLLQSAEPIFIIVGTKKVHDAKSPKPLRIPLCHSLNSEGLEVCLFTKDPQKDYKALLAKKGITKVSKVIGISKLRAKYKSFESKRQLCSSYGMFLTDDRILPMLPKLIGKTFFEKKKQPIPINMKAKKLDKEITRAIESTYFVYNGGCCLALKVAHCDMTEEQIVENIQIAVESLVERIPRKWKNVQSVHVKTGKSIALPIFHSLPEETIAISGKKNADRLEEKEGEEAEDDAESETMSDHEE